MAKLWRPSERKRVFDQRNDGADSVDCDAGCGEARIVLLQRTGAPGLERKGREAGDQPHVDERDDVGGGKGGKEEDSLHDNEAEDAEGVLQSVERLAGQLGELVEELGRRLRAIEERQERERGREKEKGRRRSEQSRKQGRKQRSNKKVENKGRAKRSSKKVENRCRKHGRNQMSKTTPKQSRCRKNAETNP